MNKICIVLIVFCMQIAGMDSDSKILIFNHIDFKSKINLGLASKQCLASYKNSLQNLSLNEYIDGLYGFFFNKQAFAELVNCNDKHLIPLINYQIVWGQSCPCNFACSTADCSVYDDKDFYLEKRQRMQTDGMIVDLMNKIIKKNRKEELKFLTPYFHTRLVVCLFGENYTEKCFNHILNNICSFFGQESSLENFKTIEKKIKNKELVIDEVIINKALKFNNYSALVFLLHNLYEIYSKALSPGILSILDTVADEKKRLLIQAGYDVESLIQLFRQAMDDKNVGEVESLFAIILESGNFNFCDKRYVYSYVLEFEHYDWIPKLFEEKEISRIFNGYRLNIKQIYIIIKTCYEHYGKNLWQNPRACHFLDLALCSVGYDKKILDYLSSIMDTLPFPEYHRELLNKLRESKNFETDESFGKKMEFLLSKDIDMTLLRLPNVNSYCKDKNYYGSDLYSLLHHVSEDVIIKKIVKKKNTTNRTNQVDLIQNLFHYARLEEKWSLAGSLLPYITTDHNYKTWKDIIFVFLYAESCYLNDIVVNLQQNELIDIEQVLQWYDQEKLNNERSEELINIVLNNQGLNDDKAKELLLDAINAKQWFYVEWLLKRKEINIVKHVPDRLFEIFEHCDKRNIVNHVAQANFTHDERKEFLYRAGIWKTADVIFCMWWYAISNLKKTLIYCGSLAILASIVVGLCYQLTPINLIM